MERLTPVGRAFLATALVALGVEHFIFQEFVTGRAPPWPDGVPGGVAWAYASGLVVAGGGVAILVGKRVRLAAFVVAALVFCWALLRHVPVVTADSLLGVSWTSAGKALVLVGGTLAVGGTLPGARRRWWLLTAGRASLGIFLVVTGIQHFLFTAFVASLIPAWFPGDPIFWTYFAGVALIAGGVGLLVPRTARLAALMSGLMVFSWFWIVHLPRTFSTTTDGIALFEALAVSGIAFMLAGALDGPARDTSDQSPGVVGRPEVRAAMDM